MLPSAYFGYTVLNDLSNANFPDVNFPFGHCDSAMNSRF